jgi:hypothetical protein
MSAKVIALWDQRPVRLAFSAVAAVVLVAGLISFVVSRQSSTPNYTGGAPYTAPSATQQYGEKVKLPVEARTLARSFVRDGVLRHDPWAARSMVSAKLQSVVTKQQWKAGTIPVPQFPDSVFAGAAYKVLRSRTHDVLLDVQMASTNPSVTKSLNVLIEMKPVGGHWIVVSAAPRNSTAVPSAQ